MGLALHFHGELKFTNVRNGRERDTKRKKESFPQALAHLQALQNEFFVPPHCQRWFPLKQTRRNRLKLPHQHKCRSASSSHRSMSKIVSQSVLNVGYLAFSTQKCEPNEVERWHWVSRNANQLALNVDSSAQRWKMRENGAQSWFLALSLELLCSYIQLWLFFLLSSLVDNLFGLR